MPHVNIWIRRDDWDEWQAIKDKPTFLHNAIRLSESYKNTTPAFKKVVKEKLAELKVEAQEVVRCEGTHYMSRKDCGKPGCPWGGVK